MSAAEEDVQIALDPHSVSETLAEVKAFDRSLSTQIRRRVRDAGKVVLNDVAAEIRAYPARTYEKGMRDQLARSLAVRIYSSATSKKQGVEVASTGRLLPAQKKALVKTMNLRSFKHPVWGNRSAGESLVTSLRTRLQQKGHPHHWVEQSGMAYFRPEVVRRHESTVVDLMTSALNDAAEAMKK